MSLCHVPGQSKGTSPFPPLLPPLNKMDLFFFPPLPPKESVCAVCTWAPFFPSPFPFPLFPKKPPETGMPPPFRVRQAPPTDGRSRSGRRTQPLHVPQERSEFTEEKNNEKMPFLLIPSRSFIAPPGPLVRLENNVVFPARREREKTARKLSLPLGGIFLICKFPITPRKILFSSSQKRGSGNFLAGGSDANSGKCGQRYLAYTIIVRGGGRFLFEVFCQKPPRQPNEPCGGYGFFPHLFAPPPPPPPLPPSPSRHYTQTRFLDRREN